MKKILLGLLTDLDIQTGAIGTAMAIVFPTLDQFTHLFQFLGAGGGLILLWLSIKHKILEIKKSKKP